MNNFEQNPNLKERIAQVVENLELIVDGRDSLSAIERDIVLQSLREAYLAVLKMPAAETAPCARPAAPVAVASPEPTQEPTLPFAPEPEEEPAAPVGTPAPELKPATEPTPEPAPAASPAPKEPAPEPPIPEPAPAEVQPAVPEPVAEASVELVAEPTIPEPAEPTAPQEPCLVDTTPDILDFLSTKISADTKEEAAFEAKVELQSAPFAHEMPQSEPAPAPKPAPASRTQPAPKPAQKMSLNDLLTQQMEDNSLGNKFQNAKIDDLAKAISINDKFLFIRELFKNKGDEFSVAIQQLNKCRDIDEAFQEIDNLKRYYSWDTSSAAYLSLCDLVRRKFI